jgi:3-methyladenine DNA glycosylase AlkC
VTPSPRRKGARRPDLVPVETLSALEAGAIESANLMEQIALNLDNLLLQQLPEIAGGTLAQLPLKSRMFAAADRLSTVLQPSAVLPTVGGRCDTVRAIGALAIGRNANLPPTERLRLLRPFANDPHFAVREWAWIGLRDQLGEQLISLVPDLVLWASCPSPRVRRFASEITRPRGVWCRHLATLKGNPAIGAPLLDRLMEDSASYVQLSVGNWLNDAHWTAREWTVTYCEFWLARSDLAATKRICQRALRRATALAP